LTLGRATHAALGHHKNPTRPAHHKAPIMAGYVSEFTQFITELKAAKPQLEAEQRKGRAIWWDKQPLDVKERSEQDAARVPQKPYPYSTN